MKDLSKHPYLSGNYAPVETQLSEEPCEVNGSIPEELYGGQYVRNTSNPRPLHGAQQRVAHFFDGHGMLSAVYFPFSNGKQGTPVYTNRYILTDVYMAEYERDFRGPILPSITLLLGPWSTLFTIISQTFGLVWMVVSSFIRQAYTPIRRISVANTNVVYHDGRVLALCETGPPMRVSLPNLETVGWFDGSMVEGDLKDSQATVAKSGFAGTGWLSFFREWTTAHPHIDLATGEMMILHSTFVGPFVRYSILGSLKGKKGLQSQVLGRPVTGIPSPRIMHDFGVSRLHSVIIDTPLSLNPTNLVFGKSVICFDPKGKTRFGIFPRHLPENVQWFSTDPCCIMHTVNTWSEAVDENPQHNANINMLVCRMPHAWLLYNTGNLASPLQPDSREESHLYYYRFSLGESQNTITEEWALSAIQFELPVVPDHLAMSNTRFVYGCSVEPRNEEEKSMEALKIKMLVKIDVQRLIAHGLANPPTPVSGCVDSRSADDILAADNPNDPIQIFKMPGKYFAQEFVFVPRKEGRSEDDGWILTYVFDESQLDHNGDAPPDAKSELWIIDAKDMKQVVSRIILPQRMPYGLHGNWFSKEEIAQQRPVERFRTLDQEEREKF